MCQRVLCQGAALHGPVAAQRGTATHASQHRPSLLSVYLLLLPAPTHRAHSPTHPPTPFHLPAAPEAKKAKEAEEEEEEDDDA